MLEDEPLEGGIFGFDTLDDAGEIAREALHLYRHPITEAHRLFGLATTEAPLLLPSIAQDAASVVRRVLHSSRQGDFEWKQILDENNDDILGRENRKRAELVRLFLLTPEISENGALQNGYALARGKVAQAFVEHFSFMSLEQIREVYGKFGLQVTKNGGFVGQSILRRVSPVLH